MKTSASSPLLLLAALFLLPACSTLGLTDHEPIDLNMSVDLENLMAQASDPESTSSQLINELIAAVPASIKCDSLIRRLNWDSLDWKHLNWDKNNPPDFEKVLVAFPNGNLISAPENIVEGEYVQVAVYAPKLTRTYLRIAQTGTLDDPNDRSYYGSTQGVTAGESIKSDTLLPAIDDHGACGVYYTKLSPYGPGTGSFEIHASVADADLKLGEIKFPVKKRYVGILTFGGVYSTMKSPSYALVPVDPADSNTLSQIIETNNQRAHVIVGFSPIWGGPKFVGDNHKPGRLFVDPFFGVDVTDPMDNLFLGVTLNAGWIAFLHAGFHFGKVQTLPQTGAFKSNAHVPRNTVLSEVLVDDWSTRAFIGVSIDAASATTAFSKTIRELFK